MTSARRRVAALACAAALAAAGCGGDDEEGGGDARPTDTESRSHLPSATDLGGSARHQPGADAFLESGCLGCHRLGGYGNAGPGRDLSRIGARMSRDEIERTLVDPEPPMPSYARLRQSTPREFEAMLDFLAGVR